MSGGSYDYAYFKMEMMAQEMKVNTPLRKAFRTHLLKVAQACRDIEWEDSGDGADCETSMRDVLGENADVLTLQEAIVEAEAVAGLLGGQIKIAKRKAK
jgi:hypothetical protein